MNPEGSYKPTSKGTFIVIEGTDGSGKSTQFQLLVERLRKTGYKVATFDFPQYDQPSSYFVSQYLNGAYGGADEVGPYTASLFYALDRYEAAAKIRDALEQGYIVLANRFTGSNMAHQGTKFANAEQRRGFFIWEDNLEFVMLNIPRPTVSFVLRVPAEIAQNMVDQKDQRSYTDKKRDIHEASLDHLRRSVDVYDDLTQLFPKDFVRIDCVRDSGLMPIETIHELIWQKVEPMLPDVNAQPMHLTPQPTVAVQAENPYIHQNELGQYQITEAGRHFLEETVTNVDSNVYAMTDKLGNTTVAAAMARLSRRPGDMRLTILDEFAQTVGKDDQLLQRIITAYGDDSVQQLAGAHIVVEGASNLLTKKLEWGRLAAYLEQSTRYIYYDQKDGDGNYNYFVPSYLPAELKASYVDHMNELFDTYSDLVHKLTDYVTQNSSVPEAERDGAFRGAVRAQACDAARAVLPVAAKSTVGIFASGQALESLIMHLQSDELPEARDTGQKILEESRKVLPTFLERADKPDRGGATIAYMANTKKAVASLAKEFLPDNHAGQTEPVQLVSVWPRNELDILPDILYEHSNLPLRDIQNQVASWPYSRKLEVFDAFIGERLNRRHRPGRALEKAHYTWDLVCDYGIFRDLQRHRMVEDLAWQELTPRYGYDIPKLVDDAGLSDDFERCFDISLELHSLMQQGGYLLEAQYATLLGHKMRWKVMYNAREAFHLHEIRTSSQGHPGYRKLVGQMHEKLAEVHPMLAEAMKFVNKDEDPELTRLAAERYTQFKLRQLDQAGAEPPARPPQ